MSDANPDPQGDSPDFRLLLRFQNPQLEREFRNSYWVDYLPYARIAMFSAAGLGGAFGILDNLVANYAWQSLLLIRYAVLVPAILIAAALSYVPRIQEIYQVILMPTIIVVSGSIIAMISVIQPPASDYYYAGLIMVLFFSYTFLQLRLIQAFITATIIFFGYEVVALFLYGHGDPALINNTFFLIATNYGGIFACYSIEKDRRQKFYRLHVIEKERRRIAQTQDRLEKISSEDGLTGLGNRRDLQRRTVQCVAQFRASFQPTAVIVLDLDNFKRVNDDFGHVAGDEVLKKTSAIILGCLRDRDFAFRYGGDEFVIFLPGKSVLGGIVTAARIRSEFRDWSKSSAVNESSNLGLSIGITEFCSEVDTVESIMRRGDEALYKAKRRGKGLIVVIPGHASKIQATASLDDLV